VAAPFEVVSGTLAVKAFEVPITVLPVGAPAGALVPLARFGTAAKAPVALLVRFRISDDPFAKPETDVGT
jgi:hypothetical protein